jgi:hypothetical protein
MLRLLLVDDEGQPISLHVLIDIAVPSLWAARCSWPRFEATIAQLMRMRGE